MKKSLGAKTVLYPTPVLVVGSYDTDGKANAMTAAWGGVACSKPPCISVSLRAATASHGNIMARKAFTISLPGEANAAQADYFGLVSGRDHDKFAESGCTAVRSELVDAPYVGEFPLVLECAVVAVPDKALGEAPAALVVLKPGTEATAKELRDHCKERLARFKVPRDVHFREALPKGGTGKILKAELREPFWKGHDSRVQ